MGIRKAKIEDGKEIGDLLRQLDYGDTESFLKEKIEILLNHPDAELLVYEYENKAIAFISIHFIPQIALRGDFARISYFAVDQAFRNQGIGREIEEYCVTLAQRRNCDRIEVHSHSRREQAHRFYFRQGYIESPKYLIKKIV
jgi:GNAT superfamily N-acetyltransferase